MRDNGSFCDPLNRLGEIPKDSIFFPKKLQFSVKNAILQAENGTKVPTRGIIPDSQDIALSNERSVESIG